MNDDGTNNPSLLTHFPFLPPIREIWLSPFQREKEKTGILQYAIIIGWLEGQKLGDGGRQEVRNSMREGRKYIIILAKCGLNWIGLRKGVFIYIDEDEGGKGGEGRELKAKGEFS